MPATLLLPQVFLDELDALAPARSVSAGGNDQIYASVVCTLLALLDGLQVGAGRAGARVQPRCGANQSGI
jgi:SpoVK/Ycf46/Vps4 family AAA+-type ATPase